MVSKKREAAEVPKQSRNSRNRSHERTKISRLRNRDLFGDCFRKLVCKPRKLDGALIGANARHSGGANGDQLQLQKVVLAGQAANRELVATAAGIRPACQHE